MSNGCERRRLTAGGLCALCLDPVAALTPRFCARSLKGADKLQVLQAYRPLWEWSRRPSSVLLTEPWTPGKLVHGSVE